MIEAMAAAGDAISPLVRASLGNHDPEPRPDVRVSFGKRGRK
jgi:hypothetical protein